MTNELQKRTEPASLEYVPFGAADKIKLSVSIVKQFCCTPTRSGQVCSDRDAMRFMMLCSAQKLNPFTNDAYLVGYDGKNGAQFNLITAHIAVLKRAETSPDYEGMESGIIYLDGEAGVKEREGDFALPDENVIGGWARVHRKGRRPTYRRLSIEAMKPNYETPFWSKAKAPSQIVKCAEADALRSTFPTLLGGLHIDGDIVDISAIRMSAQFPTLKAGQISTAPKTEAPASEVAGQAQEGVEERGEPEAPPPSVAGSVAELAELVSSNGFTFAHFVKWGVESGNIKDADALPGWEAVTEADAKRLLRAKVGLLKGLAMAKESEAA